MNIAYNCKFCKRPGIAVAEDGVDMFQIQKWIPMLACNRCADYMEGKRKLIDSIKKVCLDLVAADHRGKRNSEIETSSRAMLEALTKKFARIVCDYFHLQNVWDVEFVNMLMEKPGRFWDICHQYIKSTRQLVKSGV